MAVAEIRRHQHQEPLGILARGFFDSARAVFERADAGRGLVDFAFSPGAYCLRHGLELLTKQMSLYVAYELKNDKLRYKAGHDLKRTWKKIRATVQDAASNAMASPSEWAVEDIAHHFDVIDSLIDDLHKLDPNGTALRYPVALPFSFDAVNLSDLAAMSKAALDASQMLLAFAEEQADRVAERRGDMPHDFHALVEALRGPETERDRIGREYDDAIKARYQRGRMLRGEGKQPHEVPTDPKYAAAESEIQRLQGSSATLGGKHAGPGSDD